MFPSMRETADRNSTENRTEFRMSNETAPLRGKNKNDAQFRYVVITMVVVTVAVTIAFVIQIILGDPQVTSKSAIVSDDDECSDLGMEILRSGGSAVDGAIVTYLCLSVVHPHVAGLGGGGFMLVRDGARKITSLDFRETAPFDERATYEADLPISTVGVPGTLHGLTTAHELYGKIPWVDLVSRVSKLAREGFVVSPYLAQALKQNKQMLGPIFEVSSNLSDEYILGKKFRRNNYAKTLDDIAKYGSDVIYDENSVILQLIRNHKGGFLRAVDFSNYSTVVSEPLQIPWKGRRLSTSPQPSSGPVLLTALDFFENYTISVNTSFSDLIPFILEAWKVGSWAANQIEKSQSNDSFASQIISMIDKAGIEMQIDMPAMITRVSRGSSVLAVDDHDNFVALISGLGSWFGSQIVVDGIILNDALKDFPPGSWKPGGRPPTTMSAIVIDHVTQPCGLRAISSGSSGQLLLEVLIENLLLNKSISEAIDAPRFAFSLRDNRTFLEEDYHPGLDESALARLRMNNLEIFDVKPPYISINMLSKVIDDVTTYSDTRTNSTF